MIKRLTRDMLGIYAIVVALVLAGTASAQVGKNSGVLNPNRATEEELLALPHVDAAVVGRIIEERPFLTILELHAVLKGSLDKDQLDELYGSVFVPVNLNHTTEEEVLLIPGVGPRMAHEFEEYRPYKSLAQFRREIGKYVDSDEVARLEQYVFVPIDLNLATDEDILSIPGVGKRMLHEFKEYRPYRNIEQFRREIGKYVDEKEVARLERYLLLK